LIHTTLHQLKVFETTARLGSFTKAAEELEITQPTVSSQVKQLTTAIGLPLFEQIGKQLYLTETGKELLLTCDGVFSHLDNFEMKVADLKGTKEGKLHLAVITTAKYFVLRLLGSFCKLYPDIDISLQVVNHQQIKQRMLNNQDDLFILSQPPTEIDLQCQSFLDNPLVVVARKDHPLANRTQISLKELQSCPFILREVGSGTRKVVQNFFQEHKLSIKVRLELGSNESIKQAILGDLGISILSKHTLNTDSQDLAILNVQGFPIMQHWYLCYLAGKKLSVITETFSDFLLDSSKLIDV
jgi:DNA-binding transcriptional LysR family regulator